MTNKINGIDVSESVLTATNNGVYYSQKVVDELQNNIKRLQEENKELKEKNKSIAKDYIDVFGDYQKYKQALKEIRENILSRYSIDKTKEIIAEYFGMNLSSNEIYENNQAISYLENIQ